MDCKYASYTEDLELREGLPSQVLLTIHQVSFRFRREYRSEQMLLAIPLSVIVGQ